MERETRDKGGTTVHLSYSPWLMAQRAGFFFVFFLNPKNETQQSDDVLSVSF